MPTKSSPKPCATPMKAGVDLSELPLEALQGFSKLISDDVYGVLTPEGSLNARNHLLRPRPNRYASKSNAGGKCQLNPQMPSEEMFRRHF